MSCTLHFVVLICLILTCNSTKEKSKGDEKWKKKDIRDYSEADLERLFDQWEVSSSTSSMGGSKLVFEEINYRLLNANMFALS